MLRLGLELAEASAFFSSFFSLGGALLEQLASAKQ
jgi:hypothetical protein